MLSPKSISVLLALFVAASEATFNKIVLTNDDGWAVAQIRAQKNALTKAGFDVILSAPALNESGHGSLSRPATKLKVPCEYDSCPIGSPAEGYNQSDTSLNYVNAFPIDAVRYGIKTLAPKFFNGSQPDFVVSGPNVGANLGIIDIFSGTVGAAAEAAVMGIPSIAVSGVSTSQVSYTTLTSDPTSKTSLAAEIYSVLSVAFIEKLFANSTSSILPAGTSLNINYPATDNCVDVSNFRFVLSRVDWDPFSTDVHTCGSHHLPTETLVHSTPGCYVSVSVFDAKTKTDANAMAQRVVLNKLSGLFTCLPETCLPEASELLFRLQ